MLSPDMIAANDQLESQVRRRRTFAIISHPDAGKTTLTEKLLLYAGAVDQAGSVRARKNQRRATSDWMALEQQRGISITSTVLQFEYQDHLFNLLDTPGHQDFGEDTYRTLMAVDSAVMVLDSAKGIEPQTVKLFKICRQRNLPLLTFINKLDQPGRDPLQLLDEIESVLNLKAAPLNWPVGTGDKFKGVYDLVRQQVLLFERSAGGRYRAPVAVTDLYDPQLAALIGEAAYAELREDIELVVGASAPFDPAAFARGEQTPVFFGSALNNFGVEPFVEAIIGLAPAPQPHMSAQGLITPENEGFSGFVFKIQANMDPQHRDSIAFVRVCSGRFEKDVVVHHSRSSQKIRLSRPHRIFAGERETIDEAYPGDVIGLSNPGAFMIGDTLSAGVRLEYPPIPAFQPECFALLRNTAADKYKQFRKGLEQLRQEGVVQVLYDRAGGRREPILAAVGQLQFDVVLSRLVTEYRAEAEVLPLPYVTAGWIEADEQALAALYWPQGSLMTADPLGQIVGLFRSEWELSYFVERNTTAHVSDAAGIALRPTR